MRFGIFYEHQLPRPWLEGDEERLFSDILDQIELADRIGVDYVWQVEHHFLEEYSHSSAPETLLAACSQRTKRIRLGHGVMLMPPAYNHPVRAAERIATLDLLSHGRVEWGTGESSSQWEMDGFRLNRRDKHAMWEEAVRETAKMLSLSPYPGHRGRFFSIPTRNIVPKPVQKPHPPLWVSCLGRNNKEGIRSAAKNGMGVLTSTFTKVEEARFWVGEYDRIIREECKPLGLAVNPNFAMTINFMCHENSRVALERCREGFLFFDHAFKHYLEQVKKNSPPPDFSLFTDFYLRKTGTEAQPFGLIGNPEEIIGKLEQYEAAGIDQIILLLQCGRIKHEHICESLQLLGDRILPVFKDKKIIKALTELHPVGRG